MLRRLTRDDDSMCARAALADLEGGWFTLPRLPLVRDAVTLTKKFTIFLLCIMDESVPLTSCHVVRLAATGNCFPTGLSSSYSSTFPCELEGMITRADFMRDVKGVNRALESYWPCDTAYVCSIFLIPFTCGLTLLCQDSCGCIAEASTHAQEKLTKLNAMPRYASRGITWRLHRQCGKSWIEISVPGTYSATARSGASGAPASVEIAA